MGVSFIIEVGDKGDSAMKICEEETIPEMVRSDEGREFGTVVKWIDEKGFGYIRRKRGGKEYVCFAVLTATTSRRREILLTPRLHIEHMFTPVPAKTSPPKKAYAFPSSLKRMTKVQRQKTSVKKILSALLA